jgi:zinc protease
MIRTARLAAVAASVLALAACAHFHKQTDSTAKAAPAAQPATTTAVTSPPRTGATPNSTVDRRPKGVWPQTYSDLAADPDVKFGKLPNGMRYAIMKNATPSGQASIRLRFDAGSIMERDDQQGLAHFLEHMAFNGSKKVPEGEMVKILERHGLAFGADTNASTGFTETVYQLDLPRTDDDTVNTSLMLMREASSELLIAQDAMDRERGVVLSEERTRDGPQLHMIINELDFLLPGHLAPKRIPIGKVDILRSAPNSLMRDFYQKYYRPERAVLVMVGDFDPAAIEAKIAKTFGDWKAVGPAGPEPVLKQPTPRGPEVRVHVEAGLPTTVQLGWIAPPDLDPDTKAERREDLIDMLGFAAFNRRLERISRGANPPFIAAGAYRGDQFHSARLTAVQVQAHPGRWKDALTATEQEQRRLVQFGIRQDELDREIDQLRTELRQRAQSMSTRRTPRLADEIIGTIEDSVVETNPAQDLALFEEQVKGLTAAEVSASLREAFSGSGPLVFMASPTPVEGGDQAVLAALNTSRATPVAAAVADAQKSWPYETFGPVGKVAERTEIADLDTVFVRFENGVRLTVKPTKFRKDEILVAARFGDGRLAMPTDRITAAWAAPASFTEGGLDQLTAEEIESIMRSKVVSAGVGIDDDAVILQGRTRPEDLATELQLLTAHAVHPGWRPQAFERIRNVGATIHDQQDATPGGVFGREVNKLLHSGDARWGFPTRAEIAASKPEDLQALLKTPLATGPIEVVIVGDTTVEKAIETVAATFGALPPRPGPEYRPGANRATAFPAANSQPVTLTHKGRADQGLGYLAWPTDDFFADMQKTRTIRVMADILDLRLIEEIREKQGTTYSPQVGSQASSVFKGYGFVSTAIEAQAEKLQPFFADVAKIAADLRSTPVTQDELDRAKKPALEALEKRKETNEFWLGQLSGAQAERRKLDAIRTASSGIQRVTAADIQAAARQYLRDDKAWKVVVVPAAK